MQNYYTYTAQELVRCAQIPIHLLTSTEALFNTMACDMADVIRENNQKGEETVLIIPVGPTGQYAPFVEIVNRERIDLSGCWFFNMDEYLGDDGKWIEADHSLSFRGFMDREVWARINEELLPPPSQRIFPKPEDPREISERLEALGGADVCFGGIGINGHLAFNEADAEMSAEAFGALGCRVLDISAETRVANAIASLGGALDMMPARAVTIGMKEILSAKAIRLGVLRTWHRAVVRRAACGLVEAGFPASLLQRHPDVKIYCNEVAAERAFS